MPSGSAATMLIGSLCHEHFQFFSETGNTGGNWKHKVLVSWRGGGGGAQKNMVQRHRQVAAGIYTNSAASLSYETVPAPNETVHKGFWRQRHQVFLSEAGTIE